jgi:hypothetical protein
MGLIIQMGTGSRKIFAAMAPGLAIKSLGMKMEI